MILFKLRVISTVIDHAYFFIFDGYILCVGQVM